MYPVYPSFSNLRVELLIESEEILLLTPFTYHCNHYELSITAPEGFVCNGMSIPRFLWSFVGHPFYRKNIKQSIIHDYLYRYHIYSRRKTDKILYRSLLHDREEYEAYGFYVGVRLFGSPAYRKNKGLTLPS